MMRILGPTLVAIIIGLLMWHGATQYLMGRNPWDKKILEAKSILYYEVTEKRPLSFAIFPTDRELRIVSHVVLPQTGYFDPELRYRYGLRVRVREGGQDTWQHDFWTETRQSKEDLQDGLWLKESAFSLSGMEVSDDRMVSISLPYDIPAREGSLTIELLEWPNAPALVRTYRTKVLTPLEVARTELALSDDERTPLVQRVFRPRWRDLTPFERGRLLGTNWERITPVGISGVDYVGIPLYITTFQLPAVTPPVIVGEKLAPNQGIALNLRGHATIGLHARLIAEPASFAHQRSTLPLPQPSAEPRDCTLSVSVLDTSETTRDLSMRATLTSEDFAHLGDVEIQSSGISTLRVINTCSHWISLAPVVSEEDRTRLIGDLVTVPAPQGMGEGRIVQPDYRYFNVVRIGAGLTADFPLFRNGTASTARVLAYPVFPEFSAEPNSFSVHMTLRNETGSVILEQTTTGETVASPLEDFPHQDPAIGEFPGAPQVVFVRFPPGAYTLTLSADAPVDVMVQAPYSLYQEAVPDPDYQVETGNLIWRNEPLDVTRFATVNVGDETMLLTAGRIRTLRAQPRLDFPPESRQGWTTAFRPVEPAGTPECAKLLEQARNPLERREDWTYTTFTELRPDTPVRAEIPSLFFGRPVTLRYEASDASLLGTAITLRTDDTTAVPHLIRSLIGETTVRLVPGVHALTLSGPAENIRYFINVPVEASPLGDRYTQRTVCRLGPALLRFPLASSGSGRVSVNVLVYRVGGLGPVTLSGIFDGGKPNLRAPALSTGITPAERTESLVFDQFSRSILDTRRDLRVAAPQVFVMTLFEDAARGGHILTLHNRGREDLWVRAFIAGEQNIPGEGYMVWTTTR